MHHDTEIFMQEFSKLDKKKTGVRYFSNGRNVKKLW